MPDELFEPICDLIGYLFIELIWIPILWPILEPVCWLIGSLLIWLLSAGYFCPGTRRR